MNGFEPTAAIAYCTEIHSEYFYSKCVNTAWVVGGIVLSSMSHLKALQNLSLNSDFEETKTGRPVRCGCTLPTLRSCIPHQFHHIFEHYLERSMKYEKLQLFRVVGIVTVVSLFIYSSSSPTPIFISRPPITKRLNAYFIPFPPKPRCGTLMNCGNWTDRPIPFLEECPPNSPYASCGVEAVRRWKWEGKAQACGVGHITRQAARQLLAGRWVACVGDSIARYLCSGLLRLLGAPPSAFIFDRHSDFDRIIPLVDVAGKGRGADDASARITFHWHPFPQNASERMLAWRHEKKPSLIVTSITLWHMLHIESPPKFESEVKALAEATTTMLPKLPNVPKPVVVLATGTEVYQERLLNPQKRASMASLAVDEYNRAMHVSGAFAPSGPFGILDMMALTHGCGLDCSIDGIHSHAHVYDAATQILLNIFRQCIKSAQQPGNNDGEGRPASSCW